MEVPSISMQETSNNRIKKLLLSLVGRLTGAVFLVSLLLIFMILMRLLDAKRLPERTIRTMETVDELALPPPPPLEIQSTPPPPPPPSPSLPRLELEIENISQPLVATLDPQIDLTMKNVEFELESIPIDQPDVLSVKTPINTIPSPKILPKPVIRGPLSIGDLDSKPRLLNRPSTRYPSALLRRGIRSGNVVLEVTISTNGRVKIRNVLSSTHPELTKMATSFASRARFSIPKKDGKSVEAIYRWPMTLQPPK